MTIKGTNKPNGIPSKKQFSFELLLFLFGLLLIAALIFISIYYPTVIHENFTIYKVILAISCAGVASVIPGFFRMQYKGLIRTSGAIGVFTFLVLFLKQEEKVFFVRVIVKTDNSKRIEPDAKIVMYLGNEPREELLHENNDAIFENIPVSYLRQKVKFDLHFTENYQITFPDSSYELTPEKIINLNINLSLNNVVKGIVLYNDQPLVGVRVSIDDISDTTDENGNYKIELKQKKLQDEQIVRFYKSGYRLIQKPIFLQTLKTLDMTLEKQ